MHSFLSAKVNLILISFFISLKLSFSQNVIGYIPYWKGDVSNIQYDKLTHINYSFAIPDATQLNSSYYWSSSEYTYNGAWGFNFFNGISTNSTSKHPTYYIRAIRSF